MIPLVLQQRCLKPPGSRTITENMTVNFLVATRGYLLKLASVVLGKFIRGPHDQVSLSSGLNMLGVSIF